MPQDPAKLTDAGIAMSMDRITGMLKDIKDLKEDKVALTDKQDRSWKWLKRGGGFLAFDVIISIAGLIGGIFLFTSIHQIEVQQTNSCYFTRLVLNNYDASSPARLAYKRGPKEYDDAFRGMYTGAVKQGCPGIVLPKFPAE